MKGTLVDLGWKTMGLFELTALPSIKKDIWASSIRDADALLVWGGDPLYLAYWFERSGLTEVLVSLNKDLVYVGVSAGSMAVNTVFGETESDPRAGSGTPLTIQNVAFNTAGGEISKTLYTGKGAGLTDFAVIPHFNNPAFQDACGSNAEIWAAKIPAAVYAIDEQTAIKVVGGQVEVVSEGKWKLLASQLDIAVNTLPATSTIANGPEREQAIPFYDMLKSRKKRLISCKIFNLNKIIFNRRQKH